MLSDLVLVLLFVPMYVLAGYVSAWVLFRAIPWRLIRAIILLIPALLLISFGSLMLLAVVFPTLSGFGGLTAFVSAVPGLPAALAVAIFCLKSWDKRKDTQAEAMK